jgi:drug/metabolite transporter (DMT)-like permease
MMELWVVLSVAAAFFQNVRSALQKTLTGRVDVLGATYARFLFAVPWAFLAAFLLARADPAGWPGMTPAFAGWALLGAAGQITAQMLLLYLFTLRNFAVGNTFARTETVIAAILGALLLGDWLGLLPSLAILVSLAGVLMLSAQNGWRGGFLNRAAGIGIATGTAFALAAVAYRAAGMSLEGGGGIATRGAFTLLFVTASQTVFMTLWMRARAPGAISGVLAAWRRAAPVGLVGALASLGWFIAFTLASAAQVKAVGQIELLFSWLTARFAFGERPSARETTGIVLVAGGIVLLVLAS